MQTQKSSPQTSSPLLATAAVMVIVGAIAGILLIIPAIRNSNEILVVSLYVLMLLAPIGLLLGVVFALRSGRRAR